MRAINTMYSVEYNLRLRNAAARMSKTIARLMDEELAASRKADNAGDGESALKHDFNARALSLASQALLITEKVE